jgi:lipoprotein-anchoring transpeptidase ErfK/SrfK
MNHWIFILTWAALSLGATDTHASPESFAPAYDENSVFSNDQMTVTDELDTTTEPQLSSTPEDLSRAKIVAIINKSPIGSTAQTIRIYQNAELIYEWKVSTGREKVETAKSGRVYKTTTPVGYYRPTKLVLNYHSNTWKADMPNAVFFVGGIAVHATTHVADLGKRASGGCVRLSPENAKTFYNLVKAIPVESVPTINKSGKTLVNSHEEPVLTKNRDVLIIVENRI